MVRRLSGREIKVLIVTVTVILAASGFNGVYVPLQEKKISLDGQILIIDKQIEQDYAVIQKASKIKVKYDQYFDQFRRAGTEEEAVSSILADLEGVIRKLGLDVDDLKPQPVKDPGIHQQFSVSLSLNNDLPDVVRFLYTLQQAPHFFEVEEMHIEKITRRSSAGLKTRIVLNKVFVLSEPQVQGAWIRGQGARE